MRTHFDVIVIGAGLAGLSAAHALARHNRRVLVLEANAQPGGKIITRRWGNVAYECGALFAFDPGWAAFPVAAGARLAEDHPIGVFVGGRLCAGESVPECLQAVGLGIREAFALKHFFESATPQPSMIGAEIAATLEGFFRVIHPGALGDYVPARRRDGLTRHNVAHFEQGNAALVHAFVANTPAEIRAGCAVTRLHPASDGVVVEWQTREGEQSARADWVVLATPAPEARALMQGWQNAATDFLDRVQYGAGIAISLGLRETELQRLAYVVAPGAAINTFVFQHHPDDPRLIVVTAYLVAEQARAHWSARDDDLLELARDELNRLAIGVVEPAHIAFGDVYRWQGVGPIIAPETYRGFCNASLRAADRIVLAGDYTWWNAEQMPYGMNAAIASGKRAAEIIGADAGMVGATRWQPEPLAESWITTLAERGPETQDCVEDGTVAYYGLLLLAEPNAELEKYLLGEADDGLWEYQPGYGVTSLDSALVMEGLLATGRHHALLQRGAERLVAAFFNRGEGGFQTIPHTRRTRATYWQGADVPATAYCGWLLAQIAPARYAEIIAACAAYLKRQQLVAGNWRGKWFPSQTIPVFYATRFLVTQDAEYRNACARAWTWLVAQQRRDGAWLGSVIETSAAMLALAHLGAADDAMRRGGAWLRAQSTEAGWRGEPILEYWFDESDHKALFHTRDKGRITSAWAKLALARCTKLL